MAKKFDIEEVKKSIIKSLHKNRYYNKRHTPIKMYVNDYQKFPANTLKKQLKKVKK